MTGYRRKKYMAVDALHFCSQISSFSRGALSRSSYARSAGDAPVSDALQPRTQLGAPTKPRIRSALVYLAGGKTRAQRDRLWSSASSSPLLGGVDGMVEDGLGRGHLRGRPHVRGGVSERHRGVCISTAQASKVVQSPWNIPRISFGHIERLHGLRDRGHGLFQHSCVTF